jgi:hypothetical protein
LDQGLLLHHPAGDHRADDLPDGEAAVRLLTAAILVVFAVFAATARAADEVRWPSATTGGELRGELRAPAATADALPVVVYLKNLSIPRIGTESDEAIIADLVNSGHLVLVLDYAHHANAVGPQLAADVLKLREAIAGKNKSLLTNYKADANHVFILAEGFRLKRDVEFDRDGQRVLGMDVIYPSKPAQPVPALIEFTCDNEHRMGSFSLLFCHDTLIESGMFAGFAVAMADHPVAPPYKGLDDPMPQVLYRAKSAVRTLRSMKDELNLNGKIGVMGFSRGGPIAALLAATNDRPDLEGDGPHKDVSSAVQAALVHGNRYDYLDLLPNDPMLARFEKAWGKRDDNREKWAAHGAMYFLTSTACPMFLNTSDAESPEYRDGLAKLDKRLTELKAPHVYQVDADGRGHHVSTDPRTLAAIYAFFREQLK